MTPNASWDQCKALAEKHTDGPWEACAPGDYGDFDGESRVVCSADPDDMRRIAVVHWSERHPETDANAHLIAAAPDLLEALEEVLRWDARRGYLLPYSVRDPARAAVAKARGQL